MNSKGSYRKGDARKEQFSRIIEEGRAMFSTETDMSMAKLAKKVGLSGASSLYRYVQNKRELWFSIIINDFCDFSDHMEEIVNDPENVSYRSTLMKMCDYFLRFSREDFAKFKIMFLTEPPLPVPRNDDERGPFEKEHYPRAFHVVLNAVKKAQNAKEIKQDEDPFALTGVVWSILLGTATSTSPLYDYLGPDFYQGMLPESMANQDAQELLHGYALQKINLLLD